jgi:hypothetical protein
MDCKRCARLKRALVLRRQAELRGIARRLAQLEMHLPFEDSDSD